MGSKTYSTIFVTSILTFALITAIGISTTAFVNVLAQEGAITPEGSVNDTMSGQNASQWASNATLAFAQGDDTGMSMDNSTMMNATLAYAQQGEENATTTTTGGGGGGNATQGQIGGNTTGLTQGQTGGAGGDNGDDDDEENDEDGDENEEEEDDKDKE
jgi:hypothetical protein